MNNATNLFYKGFKIHKGERHYLIMQLYDFSERRYEIVRFAKSMSEAKKTVDRLVKTRLKRLFYR